MVGFYLQVLQVILTLHSFSVTLFTRFSLRLRLFFICVSEDGAGRGAWHSLLDLPSVFDGLRYVSLTELDRGCQFGFREPMHLCACVSEEGGDGEGAGSEASFLLTYTLIYVSFADFGRGYLFGLQEPMCTWVICAFYFFSFCLFSESVWETK
jgi:uncharacterized membrane protein